MSVSFSTIVHPDLARKSATLYRRLEALYGGMVRFFARRSALADLRDCDDFMLRDIGLARGDIEAAVHGRPVPPDWARTA